MSLSRAASVLLDHAPPEYKRMWIQRLAWRRSAHRFQVAPTGDWLAWMMRAGRGAGKTRTGAQDAVEHCLDHPGWRYAVVAPTFGDARYICIEGESGVQAVLAEMGIEDYAWNRSLGELVFGNGAQLNLYSAEKPDRLRGPQHHRAWCEELASWRDAHKGDVLGSTWNNLVLGLRLGDDPRIIITTTPKRVALVRELSERPDVAETRGTTYDNLTNLAPSFADHILRYEGTTIGRQELLGELIEDVEGALWSHGLIESHRWKYPTAPECTNITVGVDPSGGTGEIGIVAAGRITTPCPCGAEQDRMPHYAVLADSSLVASPDTWARAVVDTYSLHEADRVVAEKNFGGDMVESTLRTVDANLPLKMVTASRGKQIRAEPIAALYEQGRVHHVGGFPAMEDEQTSWTPLEPWSPNRLDALVWALTHLGDAGPQTRRIHAPTGPLG